MAKSIWSLKRVSRPAAGSQASLLSWARKLAGSAAEREIWAIHWTPLAGFHPEPLLDAAVVLPPAELVDGLAIELRLFGFRLGEGG
jgi:hypothetical protein